ncbi:helix-turn-helix domain-containing protein [Nocardia fluminea]
MLQTERANSAISCRSEVFMDVLKGIGGKIRAERRRHHLTQEELAEVAATSTRTVRDIEHGRGSPSIGTVTAVAGALGLTLTVAP